MSEYEAHPLLHLGPLSAKSGLERRLLCADARQEERRPDKGKRVGEECRRCTEELDEDAAEAGPGDVGEGPAAVQKRVRVDVVLALRDGDVQRHVGDVEEHRKRAREERDRVELPECERVEGVRDRDAGEEPGSRQVGGDHQPAPPLDALEPGARGQREEEMRDELRGGQVAHLRGVGVQHQHRGERQGDQRDLIAEE